MWLPGAGVGGEDLTAKSAKSAKNRGVITEDAKSTKAGKKITKPFVNFAIFAGEEVLAYE